VEEPLSPAASSPRSPGGGGGGGGGGPALPRALRALLPALTPARFEALALDPAFLCQARRWLRSSAWGGGLSRKALLPVPPRSLPQVSL